MKKNNKKKKKYTLNVQKLVVIFLILAMLATSVLAIFV